ncbi:MAG: hypothetical protein GY772_05625, partial [bacterium]|nr:hypothetical protein [bacterium]
MNYQVGDETITHQAGKSAGQALRAWRKLRDQPDQGFTGELLIWGQPAAWTDQVICSWVSDYLQTLYPQCIQIVDCLGSQWAEPVMLRVWANQQLMVPIAPGCTSFLQVADTHVHAQLKAHIRQVKAKLEEEWDRQALIQGEEANARWGPFHIAHVMAEALAHFRQRNGLQHQDPHHPQGQPDIFLKAFVQNQLLVFRPGQADTDLHCIDQIPEPWAQCRQIPGRYIPHSMAKRRIQDAQSWDEWGPPEPDWTWLDRLGQYLDEQHHNEGQAVP